MIYFIRCGKNGPIKIGHTCSQADKRLAELQSACPYRLRIIGRVPGTRQKEQKLHQRFKEARIRGEWFKPIPEILEYVRLNAVNEQVAVRKSPTKKSRLIRVNFSMPEDHFDRLQRASLVLDMSMSEIVRRALDLYLPKIRTDESCQTS